MRILFDPIGLAVLKRVLADLQGKLRYTRWKLVILWFHEVIPLAFLELLSHLFLT